MQGGRRSASDQPGRSRDAVGRASQELGALEVRRGELKGQLQSITERRALLSAQADHAQGAARQDFEARIKTLDERTGRIDDELNAIDDAINAALKRGVTRPPSGFDRLLEGAATTPPPMPVFEFGSRGADSSLLVNLLIGQAVSFVLLALILWRGLRRRVTAFTRLAPEDASRLEQLQRSVDVMAVEVERISEGQRYVAKVLNDPALGAGLERGKASQP